MSTSLPSPTRERWQPLRVGLTDLFLYDQEEFAFCDGRLLLRGNNGTGKSKVLALTLPFLLDGELSPHRVEPDADPNKRMEWNLLLGGEHPNPDRLGYTWLELGRVGDAGPEFCTLGCGIKASTGRGVTGHWFFLTDQRIGDDLRLVDHTGIALGFDRLDEEIGSRGDVYRRRRDYRRAIDERLFGLGELRYGAFVDLLVKIRQPQLSKRPDERGLSAALTDALPPLDEALLHNVAEAFRALEDDASELEAMVEARDASERYLTTYRAYASMATRRAARPLRQTNSEYERLGRELGAAEEEHQAAVAALAAARECLTTLRTDRAALQGRQEALREDPNADRARELRRASADAEEADRQRRDAETELERSGEQIATRSQRVRAATDELESASSARETIRGQALAHAHDAALGPVLADVLVTREAMELPRVVGELIERQRTDVARVEQLVRAVEAAQHALASARRATEHRVSEHAETTERRNGARTRAGEAGGVYARAARDHLREAVELTLDDPAAAFAALEPWLQTLHGPNPLEQAILAAGHDAIRRLQRAESDAQRRAEETRSVIVELGRETAELEAGVHPVPVAPPTRAPEVRAGPAWRPRWRRVGSSMAGSRRLVSSSTRTPRMRCSRRAICAPTVPG